MMEKPEEPDDQAPFKVPRFTVWQRIRSTVFYGFPANFEVTFAAGQTDLSTGTYWSERITFSPARCSVEVRQTGKEPMHVALRVSKKELKKLYQIVRRIKPFDLTSEGFTYSTGAPKSNSIYICAGRESNLISFGSGFVRNNDVFIRLNDLTEYTNELIARDYHAPTPKLEINA